ncbi:hypothetical protein EJ05DRAFT_520768 [Pseudovirgaria hyperparasitica]|uniref:Uncharacterized protein n=1 Tax=Pseudovirgaria hyperparasitica TaxID=470096 RepID=A0A6A6VVL2_9PEZI|nr:uncharacterized protein EJ05DRAFT_520768 [Pseudovirgaria hyperparasitica]KAF2754612.1 hypothetical protein EJ05DRAFT_520768 [Pseudovirgaria hyperparasitica]
MNNFMNVPLGPNSTSPYYQDGYWSNIDPALLQSPKHNLLPDNDQDGMDFSFLADNSQRDQWSLLDDSNLFQTPNTNTAINLPNLDPFLEHNDTNFQNWQYPAPPRSAGPFQNSKTDPPPYNALPYRPLTRSQSKFQPYTPPSLDLTPEPTHLESSTNLFETQPPKPQVPKKYLSFHDDFGSTDAAIAFLTQVQRAPFIDPAADPTIAAIESHATHHVRRIYTAIVDQSRIRDNPSARVLTRFNGSAASFPPALIVARSYTVLAALLRAVKIGWTDDVAGDVALRSKFARDRECNAEERLANVCAALAAEKQVALDVMNGEVQRLVHAPLEVAGSKARNRVSNAGKARVLMRAKEGRKGQGKGTTGKGGQY